MEEAVWPQLKGYFTTAFTDRFVKSGGMRHHTAYFDTPLNARGRIKAGCSCLQGNSKGQPCKLQRGNVTDTTKIVEHVPLALLVPLQMAYSIKEKVFYSFQTLENNCTIRKNKFRSTLHIWKNKKFFLQIQNICI